MPGQVVGRQHGLAPMAPDAVDHVAHRHGPVPEPEDAPLPPISTTLPTSLYPQPERG